jgi:hypothetical protein
MPSETHQEQPDSSNLASVLLLAASLLWCIYWFVHARGYWEDDAYIHLEFARSLAAGRGFSFNGHVVAGDTAPLWVFLLAGMHAFIPDWLAAGKALTVLGAVFGLAGIYAFARSLASSLLPPAIAKVFPAAMILLIVVNPYSIYWLFSGMEPIAAAGLACFAVLAATRNVPTAKTFLAGCLLAGLAPLLRPEMIFLTALLVLPLLAQARRLPASSAKFAVIAAGLVLLCAPVALWSFYSLHAFGHLLPNTNAAKRAGPHDSIVKRLISIYSLGFPVIVAGLLAGITCLALRPSAIRRSIQNTFTRTSQSTSTTLPLAGWIFILWPSIAAIFYIANHTYVQTRYIMVTAPGLIIVVMALALKFSRAAGRFLYLAALVWALVVSVVIVRPFIRNKALNCRAIDSLAGFMRDRLPPDAPVAAYAIGQVAFVSQHTIIDTGGITRPSAIPYLDSPPQLERWARTEGAQYEIADKPPEPGSTIVYIVDVPFTGWTFRTSQYATSGPLKIWKLPPTYDELPPLLPASPHP